MKAPFPWFGGKSRAAELIWSRLGDVGNYIEPFMGSLAVLLARPHEPRIETANDRDCYVSNFYRAVKSDPEQVAHYADWPVSECDLRARHKWLCEQPGFREKMLADTEYFDSKIAGWWVWGISQWIGAGWCSRPEWMGRGQGGRAPRGLNAQTPFERRVERDHRALCLTVHMGGPHVNGTPKGIHGQRRRVTENPDWQHLSDAGNGVHQKMPIMTRGSHGVEGAQYQKRPHLSGNGSTGVASQRPILDWMFALADRLRRVRVCCGDWSRVVTPSCTWKLGGGQLTGVLLDPPYSHELRDNRLYSVDVDVAAEVRTWALEAAKQPKMRIALCGLAGEHEMPDWEAVDWKAPRGYSNKAPRQEVIWFSPHCLQAKQRGLFDHA